MKWLSQLAMRALDLMGSDADVNEWFADLCDHLHAYSHCDGVFLIVLNPETRTARQWSAGPRKVSSLEIEDWSRPDCPIGNATYRTLEDSNSLAGWIGLCESDPSPQAVEALQDTQRLVQSTLAGMRRVGQLEDRLSLLDGLLENTGDAVFIKDCEGHYLFANSADARGFGRPREEVIGCTDYDLFERELADEIRRSDEEVMQTGQSQTFLQTYRDRPGGDRIYEVCRSPRLDEDGQVIGITGIARDITDRQRQEESLERTQRLDSLGVLAGGVAHDFRNILTVILGHAEALHLDISPVSQSARSVRAIEQASRRAHELCERLLVYAGRGTAEIEQLLATPIIEETLDLTQKALAPGQRFDLDLTAAPIPIEFDRCQFGQLVLNLVSNAVEAAPQQGGVIRISTRLTQVPSTLDFSALEDQSEALELAISDNGPGIDPEFKPRLFDPFFSTKEGGHGLGLATTLGIVRRHHCGLQVENEPAGGAVFRVYIPLAHTTISNPSRMASPSALVVEPEPHVRRLIVRALQAKGIAIHEEPLARDALGRLRKRSYDLLIADLACSNSATQLLQAAAPAGTTVIWTGLQEPPSVDAKTLRLPKPFSVRNLVAAASSQLGHRVEQVVSVAD